MMKFLAVVLVVALRLYSVVAQVDEDVQNKFKDAVGVMAKQCLDKYHLQEDDIAALKAFEIPPNQEAKCFLGCIYTQLGLISGNEFNPTQFKKTCQGWLQKHPEKYEKVEKILDTCTVKVKEANPNGGDECSLSSSIMECFHSHQEETENFRKFLENTYGA